MRLSASVVARSLRAILGPLLGVAALLSGCGGSGSDTTSATESPTIQRLAAAREASASPAPETTYTEGGKLTRADPVISALGPDLLGDRVNLYNGTLEFVQADFNVPGHPTLPMGVGRRLVTGSQQLSPGLFGDWDLEVPRMQGVFSRDVGWAVQESKVSVQRRCSAFSAPPNANAVALGVFVPAEFWHGNSLYVPGAGAQELLVRYPGTAQPSDGAAYPLVTKSQWAVSCLRTLKQGSGEGFMALSPEGTRYYFDWMVSRSYPALARATGSPDIPPGATASEKDPVRLPSPKPAGALLSRAEVWILPTLVVDRYGNTVKYTYDPANPARVSRIEGSDPSGVARVITFTYAHPQFEGVISAASDGSKTWNYDYAGSVTGARLKSVTLPDQSSWSFNLDALVNAGPFSYGSAPCEGWASLDAPPRQGSVTHPSGAVGLFTIAGTHHGRSAVPKQCQGRGGEDPSGFSLYPLYTDAWSISSKSISGPGIDTASWTYAYGPANASFEPLCDGCPTTKTVSITDSRGVLTQHTFGNRYQVNEGWLLRTEQGPLSGPPLRVTTFSYKTFANPVGTSYQARTSNDLGYRHTPEEFKSISQQGRVFRKSVVGFDDFARPITIVRATDGAVGRTEQLAYYDHTGVWVLNQLLSTTLAETGWVSESNDYDSSTANKMASYSFGRKTAGFAYNTDGTLARRTDPIDRATVFSSYKRGLARAVLFPDGQHESAQIDDSGQITAVTNAAGTTTSYEYDAMGRLAAVLPPAENGVAYNATIQSFELRNMPEYGLAAGHWRQVVSTGNARTERYFDALWRPVLTRTFDAADEAGTRRVVLRRHDIDGHNTFESYAQRDIGAVSESPTGTERAYDTLGRLTLSRADSERGPLSTITRYQDAFRRQVTDPRGKSTTTGFQTFDTPSEDAIADIQSPEGVGTTINRDLLGKPRLITRGGAWQGAALSVTRRYVYDDKQRLCKTVEPETGATVQAYDSVSLVAWRASGLALPSDACDSESVGSASKISYVYDPRGRLLTTSYGDGSPGISRSYTADGLSLTLTANDSTWTYGYNNRRLMVSENIVGAGQNLSYIWGINPNGHTQTLRYPGGQVVNHAPNALGEVTQVSVPTGNLASNVRYHPNGGIASYTLGNGVVHSESQNVRGLPQGWVDSGHIQDTYSYDENGNVLGIVDSLQASRSRSMAYDGLNRLTAANGAWGSAGYDYDPLDNVRYSRVGARELTFAYDGANRLTVASGTLPDANGTGQYLNTTLGYDVNGNVGSRNGRNYNFDIGNRLRNSSDAAGITYYGYDAHGRRTAVSYPDGSLRLQVYSHAGQLLQSIHTGGPGVPSEGNTLHVYLGSRLIAEYNERTVNGGLVGTLNYVHTDALGSPVVKSDAAGVAVANTRVSYEPYGGAVFGTPAPKGVGYTGHVNDVDTGLVYMQQRYYDPVAGRFLSVDPITTDTNTGKSFNRYAYAENNPYGHVDPDGRNAIRVIAAIVRALTKAEGKEAAKAGAREGAKAAAGAARAEGAAARSEGTVGGDRAGKPFTPAGKEQVKSENAAENGGQTTCKDCGQATVPAKQSEAGVTPPKNETHVDHVVPQSKGGDGSPSNGQVLCRDCNLKKSDK